MKKEYGARSVARFSLVIILFLLIFSTGVVQAEIAGPGWFMGNAAPVSHEEAQGYFLAQPVSRLQPIQTYGLAAAPMSATTTSPETSELARALQYDPARIYDYVHNHIDYVPYYGSLKGATLTYLDGSGNDFDQASLMISLLRASGYTAQYVYGTMTIPGDQMANWLGVDQNYNVIGNVVASGGIPVTMYADGTAIMDRVWVKATISGTDYLFDPAFKPYAYTAKIDIGTAMGYNQTDIMTASTAGATITTDYAQNMNETNLRTKLAAYSTNLVSALRSQYPNSDVKDIISGREIIQSNLTAYTTTLPYSPTVTYTWDDIPAAYIATLRIQHVNIDIPSTSPT